MQRKLIILGAGDFGREVLHAAGNNAGSWPSYDAKAFVDDDESKHGSVMEGLPVIGWNSLGDYFDEDLTDFICGAGTPPARRALTERLVQQCARARFAVVVHPSAAVLPNVTIADGAYVGPNTTLATGTSLQEHALVSQNVSVGHDCQVGVLSVISPGCVLSGRTTVGRESFLGSGAVTYPGATVGEGCTVSAMAVVSRRLGDGKKLIAKPNVMVLP